MPLNKEPVSNLMKLMKSTNRKLALAATNEYARRATNGTLEKRIRFLQDAANSVWQDMRAAELDKRLNHIDQMISTIDQISKE